MDYEIFNPTVSMTFKEFREWCNLRAADGCWSMETAIFCLGLATEINKLWFWKREKEWKKHEKYVLENVVNPIKEKMMALGL